MLTALNLSPQCVIAFVLFLALFQRLLPVVFVGVGEEFDTYFHLYFIQEIRKNSRRVPETFPRMIEQIRTVYPYLLHWLLALLPAAALPAIRILLNPVLDATLAAASTGLVLWLGFEPGAALAAGSLYIFMPLLFSVQAIGPRSATFTPRLLGECLAAICFMLLYLFEQTGSSVFLLASVLPAAAVYLSSQFSAQAIILISLAAIPFGWSPLVALCPAGGFVLAWAVGGVQFRYFLEFKLNHYRWYFRRIQRKEIQTTNRSFLVGILRALATGRQREIYRAIMMDSPLTSALIKAPLFAALLFNLPEGPLLAGAMPLLAGAGVIYVLTSLRPFLFLGEAERYLAHVALFACAIASLTLDDMVLSVLLGYGIVFSLLDLIVGSRRKKTAMAAGNELVIKDLQARKALANVATIPIHLGGWKILADTQHSWVSAFNSIMGRQDLFNSYEILAPEKLGQAAEHYRLDLLYVRAGQLTESELEVIEGKLPTFQRKYLGNEIILFERCR